VQANVCVSVHCVNLQSCTNMDYIKFRFLFFCGQKFTLDSPLLYVMLMWHNNLLKPSICILFNFRSIKEKGCKEQQRTNEQFQDGLFCDESTVQLENHSRICFHKRMQPRVLKQRAKHPIKVHIWGGISARGAAQLVIFPSIMNAERLGAVYEAGLLPFIEKCFPDHHRLY